MVDFEFVNFLVLDELLDQLIYLKPRILDIQNKFLYTGPKKKKKYQTLAFSQTHKKDTGIKIEDSTKIYI